MKTTNGRLQGPTVFREDTIHHGMVTGGVTVASGIALHFYGMIAGDLTIEPEATVDLHGHVAGSVFNQGNLTLEGRVSGAVNDAGGKSVIMSNSSRGLVSTFRNRESREVLRHVALSDRQPRLKKGSDQRQGDRS